MNIDWNDPAWWSALSALSALVVALVSLWAACVASKAAKRSAVADQLAARLAKGLARTCHARWEVTYKDQMHAETGDGDLRQNEHGTIIMTNTGDEVALNVHATGDIHEHQPVAKVQPRESITFHYDVSPDTGKRVFVEWDRPEEFEDERMRIRYGFY